jgi:hypothetical protein
LDNGLAILPRRVHGQLEESLGIALQKRKVANKFDLLDPKLSDGIATQTAQARALGRTIGQYPLQPIAGNGMGVHYMRTSHTCDSVTVDARADWQMTASDLSVLLAPSPIICQLCHNSQMTPFQPSKQ